MTVRKRVLGISLTLRQVAALAPVKVMRQRCYVIDVASRKVYFPGRGERERRFVTKSSGCAGSCRREIASAIVLEAVRICHAGTRKLYVADSQKGLRSQCNTSDFTRSALIDSA